MDSSHGNIGFECRNLCVRYWKVMHTHIFKECTMENQSDGASTPLKSLRLILKRDAKGSLEPRRLTE